MSAGLTHNERMRVLQGLDPCPPQYFITKSCKDGHGTNGKTLRYTSNDGCVLCSIEHGKQQDKATFGLRPLVHKIDDLRLELESKAACREVWE